jgi:hypothetical protein
MRSHFAGRGWIVILGGEYQYGPKVTERLRNPVRLQNGREADIPARSAFGPQADELACAGFVQEALNRFEMGVILKK